jgi:signal transduction histidine kinase
VYLNNAFKEILEIPADEDIRSLTQAQFSEITFLQMKENSMLKLNQGKWIGENMLISKSGKRIPVLMVVVLHKNELGEPMHVSATAINLTDIKEKETQLLQTNKELGDLARHLQFISELEKRTIAREIHDELGQYLTAMRMGIAWVVKHLDLNKEELELKLNEVTEIVDETIGSFKRIHSSLHPAMLEDIGLYAALEWYIKSATKHISMKVHFRSNCQKDKFQMELSLPLYRVVQEAVTNILRYSKATEANIDLMKYPNSIELIIRDNGRGLEVDKVDTSLHHGLIGMKERVYGLNGKINIQSFIGKGTTISVKIPL